MSALAFVSVRLLKYSNERRFWGTGYVLKLRAVCQIRTWEALALLVVSLICEIKHRLTTVAVHLQQKGEQDDVDLRFSAETFVSEILAHTRANEGGDVPECTYQ